MCERPLKDVGQVAQYTLRSLKYRDYPSTVSACDSVYRTTSRGISNVSNLWLSYPLPKPVRLLVDVASPRGATLQSQTLMNSDGAIAPADRVSEHLELMGPYGQGGRVRKKRFRCRSMARSQVSTFEARKAKRHARQVALAKLLKEKPAEDADDPR